MNDFSRVIKELRKNRNLTQEEMAKSLTVSKSTIGMWETGKRLPSYEILETIADTFNVDIAYLLGKQSIERLNVINNPNLYNAMSKRLHNFSDTLDNAIKEDNSTISQINKELSKMDERKLVVLLAFIKTMNGGDDQ